MTMKTVLEKCLMTAALICLAIILQGAGKGALAYAAQGTTPLYGFYNPVQKDHFLTASYDEKEQLCRSYGTHDYIYEGVYWRVETRPGNGTVPVYRFFNDVTKDHFYTTSEQEKNTLANTLASGSDHYVYEGIGWYAHASGGTAIYRLFNPDTFNHYYTMDYMDRDYMVESQGYRYEGIAWYEQQPGEFYPDNGGCPYTYNGSYSYSNSDQNSAPVSGNSGTARSDEEIVRLLDQYLSSYDQHYGWNEFLGMTDDFSIRVALYGHRTQDWYYESNRDARQPGSDELWCYLDAAAGDGILPIGNVYVNVYSGLVDATAVDFWNGADVPAHFYLW